MKGIINKDIWSDPHLVEILQSIQEASDSPLDPYVIIKDDYGHAVICRKSKIDKE